VLEGGRRIRRRERRERLQVLSTLPEPDPLQWLSLSMMSTINTTPK